MTAYKLRKAMLAKDKRLFASLLSYPFFSEDGAQAEHEWKSPRSVIEHYDEIVQFAESTVEESVPHILRTSMARTYFMHSSVIISNGKVERICVSQCELPLP